MVKQTAPEALEKLTEDLEKESAGRKAAEESLRVSDERCATILESIAEGCCEMDIEGNFTFFNDSMCKIFGYTEDELMGMNYRACTDGNVAERVDQALHGISTSGKPVKGLHWEITRKDKKKRHLDASLFLIKDSKGRAVGFRGIAMDVTDARGREAERRQAQGMEIIGMLGGRIAHKFNNILGTIIGCTELSLFSIEEGTTVYRHLTEILKAGNLAKDLVGQILTISHHEEQYLRPVRVSLIIKEVIKNLQASSPATIKIQQRIETDSDMVQAVPTQIHQMLMNLCTNARNAMGERGGVLEIGLNEVGIDSDAGAFPPEWDQKAYLTLSVRDTGCGMDPQLISRISDSYLFSKESVDEGGLGLVMTHAIVRSCGGVITVESEPGRGTIFFVHLPKIEDSTNRAIRTLDGIPA